MYTACMSSTGARPGISGPSSDRSAPGGATRRALGLGLLCAILAAGPGVGAAEARLVFGVHPYKPAIELEFMFAPLTAYLSSLIGEPVLLSVSKDYEEHVRRVGEGGVDIAFMEPALYVEMADRYGKKPLLARLETERVPTYYGVILVRKDSTIKLLKDLKGRRMAFSDRRSTSGHIIPRHMFARAGVTLADFAEHTFMANHDNVALGVLVGDFDAGAVDEEVFAKYEPRGLRILALTPPISEHLFVAGSGLDPRVVETLRSGLQRLKDVPSGGTIMRAVNPSVTALVPVEDADYDNLRAILNELKEGGVLP